MLSRIFGIRTLNVKIDFRNVILCSFTENISSHLLFRYFLPIYAIILRVYISFTDNEALTSYCEKVFTFHSIQYHRYASWKDRKQNQMEKKLERKLKVIYYCISVVYFSPTRHISVKLVATVYLFCLTDSRNSRFRHRSFYRTT